MTNPGRPCLERRLKMPERVALGGTMRLAKLSKRQWRDLYWGAMISIAAAISVGLFLATVAHERMQ